MNNKDISLNCQDFFERKIKYGWHYDKRRLHERF